MGKILRQSIVNPMYDRVDVIYSIRMVEGEERKREGIDRGITLIGY